MCHRNHLKIHYFQIFIFENDLYIMMIHFLPNKIRYYIIKTLMTLKVNKLERT